DERARANAVMSTGFELASIGGPGAAGLVLAVTKGAFAVYCAEAALTMTFAGVLTWLYVSGLGAATSTAPSSRGAASTSLDDMVAGVKFVFSSRLLLPAMTLDLFA